MTRRSMPLLFAIVCVLVGSVVALTSSPVSSPFRPSRSRRIRSQIAYKYLGNDQDPSNELPSSNGSPWFSFLRPAIDSELSPSSHVESPDDISSTMRAPVNGVVLEREAYDNAHWKQAQYDRLKQIESRLEELQSKELGDQDNYQQRIRNGLKHIRKKEAELLEKVQFFANQLQQYQMDSQKAIFAANEISKKKELELREEIKELRKKATNLDWERNIANEKAVKLRDERNALRKEAQQMEKRHTKEVTEWENRCKTEQQRVLTEREKSRMLEFQVQAATNQQAIEIEKVEMKWRMKYSKQMEEIEKDLSQLESELMGNSQYITQLEIERMSLQTLLSRSFDIISNRAKKFLKVVLRKESKYFCSL